MSFVQLGLAGSASPSLRAFAVEQSSDIPQFIITVIVLSPLAESLPFVIVLWLLDKFFDGRVLSIAYLSSMALYGWALHGASLSTVGLGAAFFILGCVGLMTRRTAGWTSVYIDVVLAHVIWNVLGSALIFSALI